MKVTLTLPLVKETEGALRYSLHGGETRAFSSVYLRKEAIYRPGQTEWPQEITVTVEVPE